MKPKSSRRLVVVLLLGIALGVVMRWVFPGADPPLSRQTGAFWWDEAWSFGARNGVLFGAWQQDAYQPWVVCPLHTVLVQAALEWFGMNGFGLRFVAMVSGTALIALTYMQARLLEFSRVAGLLATFMVATSWSLTGFSKSMTLEPTLLAFFQLSITVVLVGERATRWPLAWYALAGIAAGCATLCKTSGAVMAACMALYLLLGPAAVAVDRVWRWRAWRALTYGGAGVAAYAAGFLVWVAPSRDTFLRLAFEESLASRADTSIFLRVYKAVTWLDSQAFLSAPWLILAVLLVLPLLVRIAKRTPDTIPPIQRFAFWLCVLNAILGIAIMINIDVPARRLVYLNLYLALLAGMAYDWIRPQNDMPVLDRRSVLTPLSLLLAGLMVSGWLVSPHGGLPALLAPEAAAKILFTMPMKAADKAAWLVVGAVFASLFYRYREGIWERAPRLIVTCAVAQLALYLLASGLWLARMTHTIEETSRAIGDVAGRGRYLLGSDAVALCFLNETHPLFWSPKGYRFANFDDAAIEADYDPEYLVITELMWNRIRNGEFGDRVYAQSFDREVARFPIYEIHESPALADSIVLLERVDRR